MTDPARVIPIGHFRCYPISDGDLVYPRAAVYGEDPERTAGIPEQVPVPYTPLLVDTGSQLILIDTGAGPLAPTTGRLQESLARAGFQPRDVDFIILSHAHPDHIGGLLLDGGTPRFPNARVLMSRREYDFWNSPDLRGRLGTGSVYGSSGLENLMAAAVDRYLRPMLERLEWVVGEQEIVPGIATLDAPGHTPGHTAIAISSGGDSLLFAGDLLIVPGQVAQPDWTSIFDLDPHTLVRTRRVLLDRAAADGSIVFHYHFGQAGRFRQRGARFEWERLTA